MTSLFVKNLPQVTLNKVIHLSFSTVFSLFSLKCNKKVSFEYLCRVEYRVLRKVYDMYEYYAYKYDSSLQTSIQNILASLSLYTFLSVLFSLSLPTIPSLSQLTFPSLFLPLSSFSPSLSLTRFLS